MKKRIKDRVGATALAVVLSLSLTLPIFAAGRDERDYRDTRDRIVRIIKKIFGVTTNDDGLAPPRP